MKERKMTILSGPSREQLIGAFKYENLVRLRARDDESGVEFSLFAGIEDFTDNGENNFTMNLNILATEDTSREIRSLFDLRRRIRNVNYSADCSTGTFFV